MTLIAKKFHIEITEDEAAAITDALHMAYMDQRLKLREGNNYNGEQMSKYRELRNEIALLVGRRFMGDDA